MDVTHRQSVTVTTEAPPTFDHCVLTLKHMSLLALGLN